MSDTDVLPEVPLIADNLAVVVTERVTTPASPGVPQTVRDGARRVVSHGLTVFVALCVGLLLFLFVGTSLMHSRYQRALRDNFRRSDQLFQLPPQTKTDNTGAITVVPIATG